MDTFACAICHQTYSVESGQYPYKDTAICGKCVEIAVIDLAADVARHWEEIRDRVDPVQCDIGFSIEPLTALLKSTLLFYQSSKI